MIVKKCKNCAIFNPNSNICTVQNISITPDNPICAHYTTILYQCNCCGASVWPRASIVSDSNNKRIILCENCYQKKNTCETCHSSQFCDFQTNPSTIPPYVQKQVNMGNMQAVTTVENPDRIRETCMKNCVCWSESFKCGKTNSYCTNYTMRFAVSPIDMSGEKDAKKKD